MAIDFYELGKQTGAKTPKDQQSNFGAFMGGITNTVDQMIAASQIKTAALQAAMPQGIAIEKVPEELRAQATEFLTTNKKAYTDASKVLASGINPQSQRYRDAVEAINGVNTKFENLSTSLEGVALKRKAALDDPNGYSPSTSKEDRLTWGNLSNGDLYSNMTFNDDGTVNYTNSQGESKSFADFNVSPQSFEGQNTFLALNDKFTNAKYSGKSDQWSMHSGEAETTVNALFQKLKPAGQKDMMMGDIDYLEKTTGFQSGTDEYENAINGILENPNDAVAGYKQHMLQTLENNYNDQKGPKGKETNTNKVGGWVNSGKSLSIYGGNEYWDYDAAKLSYDSFEQAGKGEATSFKFKDNQTYNYDPATDKWSMDDGKELTEWKGSKQLIEALGISSPDFRKFIKGNTSSTNTSPSAPNIKNTPLLPDGGTYSNGVTSSGLEGSDDDVVDGLNSRIQNPGSKNYKFTFYGPDGSDIVQNNSIIIMDGDGNYIDENGQVTTDFRKAARFNTTGDAFDKNTANEVDRDAALLNALMKKLGITLKSTGSRTQLELPN